MSAVCPNQNQGTPFPFMLWFTANHKFGRMYFEDVVHLTHAAHVSRSHGRCVVWNWTSKFILCSRNMIPNDTNINESPLVWSYRFIAWDDIYILMNVIYRIMKVHSEDITIFYLKILKDFLSNIVVLWCVLFTTSNVEPDRHTVSVHSHFTWGSVYSPQTAS